MWYFKPHDILIGKDVVQGQEIGTAQDISLRYPGMQAHVHLEIDHIDPDLFMDLYWFKTEKFKKGEKTMTIFY